jgi:RNA polymerase sigma-70 factor (ECF subfamily)
MNAAAGTQQAGNDRTRARGSGPGVACPVESSEANDFEKIYATHFGFVWRTLRRFGVPDPALDDATQDVFVVVHTRLSSFEGRSSVRTWIFGVCRRVARNHRPSGRYVAVPGDQLEALPEITARSSESSADQVDAARRLQRLLDGLTPERRAAFILIEVEQMTIAEAAEALDCNPNTLYSRLRAAREDLEQAVTRDAAHRAWRERCPS